MAEFDWSAIRFLESADNLKAVVTEWSGRQPSTTHARAICACLQQGRLFYEAATESDMAIRPLQQFYGMVAFGKALASAKSGFDIATLPQTHGLTDVSEPCKRIADLTLRLGSDGTFQKFNDVVAPMIRLEYLGDQYEPRHISLPAASAADISGMTLTFADILSRVPSLHKLYKATFKEPPQAAPIQLSNHPPQPLQWELRIDEQMPFHDLPGLIGIVSDWRARFPLMRKWSLTSATRAWGNSVITFVNVLPSQQEFDGKRFVFSDGSLTVLSSENPSAADFVPIAKALNPLGGSFSGSPTAIAPFGNGHFISDYSLHYMALFLLSSLVRYRPNIWVHALSRSAFDGLPADDYALALLEEFLRLDSYVTPNLVGTILNPKAHR